MAMVYFDPQSEQIRKKKYISSKQEKTKYQEGCYDCYLYFIQYLHISNEDVQFVQEFTWEDLLSDFKMKEKGELKIKI